MDGQAIATKSDLERTLLEESMEAKALPLSLLKSITDSFSHEIGRGGFAVVYKGRLEYREVAVKKLFENCIDVDEKKFIGEVHCLMKVKHKNIVRLLGYCSDTQGEMMKYNGEWIMGDVQRLLCFEYVPNGTLDEYIKDASREWEKCYKIIKGVCEDLHYLHEERIVHRDLKPENILLDNDTVPKITDFGISRCFDELQTHDFISKPVGTLGYLAPELLSRNGKIAFKSDIYSLGIVIIEILTGDKGYPEVEKVQELWSHKLEGSRKELQLEQIRVCTEVAQRCLQYDPEKRPHVQTIIDILKQTEREERCNGTAASSHNPRSLGVVGRDCCKSGIDAAAGAATTLLTRIAAATNISKKQQPQPLYQNHSRAARAQPRKRTLDPEAVARQIEKLMQAISKFYAGDTKDMIFKELYRGIVYDLVLHKKGEELYSAAESTMASEVQSLCRPLDDAAPVDSTLFLQELLNKWDLHILNLLVVVNVFTRMDSLHLPSNFKTPIKELGLRLWRNNTRFGEIRQRLIGAVKRQKGGEDELVAGVNKMLMELGADVKDKDNLPFL